MPPIKKNLAVTSRRRGKERWCSYIYANRQKPLVQLAKAFGSTAAEATANAYKQFNRPEVVQKWAAANAPKDIPSSSAKRNVGHLVTAYLQSVEYCDLKSCTRTEYRRYLDRFREDFGGYRLEFFERAKIVEDLTEWRDGFGDHRATADYAIRCVSVLFGWADSRGWIKATPTKGIAKVHNANRRDIIWSDDQLEAVCRNTSVGVQRAVRLAAETGLRTEDLLTLSRGDIKGGAIVKRTSKRNRVVRIPLSNAAKAIIAEIPKEALVLLTSTKGEPWTKDGFKTSFGRAKSRAGLGEADLHFHDIRGTAATRFKKAGLTNEQIAKIMGWSVAYVERMMTLYVSTEADDAEVEDMARRLNG